MFIRLINLTNMAQNILPSIPTHSTLHSAGQVHFCILPRKPNTFGRQTKNKRIGTFLDWVHLYFFFVRSEANFAYVMT